MTRYLCRCGLPVGHGGSCYVLHVVTDPRPEGVYLSWETYPPEGAIIENNRLRIDKVHGDQSFTTFYCTREEAARIRDFLQTL